VVTSCWYRGEVDGYTFDNALTCHVNDFAVRAVPKVVMPCFEVWCFCCIEGRGWYGVCNVYSCVDNELVRFLGAVEDVEVA